MVARFRALRVLLSLVLVLLIALAYLLVLTHGTVIARLRGWIS